MKIIDAYCGIGPWWTRDKLQPAEASETLAIMDYCGVDSALVFSNLLFAPAWPGDANALVAEAARKQPRFISTFVLAPRPYDDSRKPQDWLPEMRAAGAKAVWLWPQANRQGHGLIPWVVDGIFEFCVAHRLPLLLSMEGVEPARIDEICGDFPQLALVLAGMSYNVDHWLFPLLRRRRQVRACLGQAYIPPLGVERFVRHFGPERLVFGSGLPFFGPGGLIGHVMYANIPDAAKEQILSGNIEALMREVRL